MKNKKKYKKAVNNYIKATAKQNNISKRKAKFILLVNQYIQAQSRADAQSKKE